MNNISERLQYLRESHNLKQQDVADSTGIARGNISKYENGVVNPSAETLIAYSKYFNVSTDWILTGEGKGPRDLAEGNSKLMECKIDDNVPSPELHLVNKLKKLASDDIEEIEMLINFKAERKRKREQMSNLISEEEAAAYDADISQKRIPLLGQVAAGIPIWAESEYMDLIPVPANNTSIDYALVVRGDSMEPEIHNGSILFVKKQAALENGDIGIILVDDSATCKKFFKYEDRIELHSLNKKYDPIVIKGSDQAVVTILGKALKVSESNTGNSFVVNSRLA